jgi:ribonuclease HI
MKPTPSYELYVDGASRGNPGPASIGAVLLDGHGRVVREVSKYVGETTNNVAEYLALIYALQEALQAGCTALTVKTDSELLARQMSGRYKVRDPQLKLLHELAAHLVAGFAQCRIEHVPREQNTRADRLAAKAVNGRARPSLFDS